MSTRARTLVTFSLLFMFSNVANLCADIVVIDFGSRATNKIIPPNHVTATSPAFEIEKLGGSAEVRLPAGADSALWYFRNSFGWAATTSFRLLDGGTFDFNSFRYESGSGLGGFNQVRGYVNGTAVAWFTFTSSPLGVIDVSSDPAFQGIDELQIQFNSNNPGIFAADNLTFNVAAIPEPAMLLPIALMSGIALTGRFRRNLR